MCRARLALDLGMPVLLPILQGPASTEGIFAGFPSPPHKVVKWAKWGSILHLDHRSWMLHRAHTRPSTLSLLLPTPTDTHTDNTFQVGYPQAQFA